jgi:hypothetical protein
VTKRVRKQIEAQLSIAQANLKNAQRNLEAARLDPSYDSYELETKEYWVTEYARIASEAEAKLA